MFSTRFVQISNIANRQEKDLSELSRQQRQLFDDISEGIVTIDLNSVITSINQAAQAIMGLTEVNPKALLGVSLPEVWQQHGLEASPELDISSTHSGAQEISLVRSGSDEELCLSYTVRPITNSDGIETGKMVLFSDVSRVRDIEMQLSLHERMTELLSRSSAALPTLNGTFSDKVQIIGESNIMHQVFSLIGKVADSDASVLISGESGTGKELVARAIHARGNRKNNPFIAVNCGAIPENLIESELFGHKKGSFTGAVSDSLGLFRQASKGTLFLDEIGELPLHLQSKLLRVIQDKRIRAVGDVHDHAVDVRLITATNRDLRKEIKAGAFREDLFYRLNVVNIIAPPLRDRTEDVPLLVRYFIGKHSDVDQVLPKISPEALASLINYPFPGNVRELENIIERALVLGGHAILPEHLPTEIREYRPSPKKPNGHSGAMPDTEIKFLPVNLEEHLADIERQYLLKALEESGGVKKQAAALLGLNFRSFRYRLKKYSLGDSNSVSEDN
jgi:two-component system response regulator PilR (NtrC family)